MPDTTSPELSVVDAASLLSKLSDPKPSGSEDQRARETTPEQQPATVAEQVPAAPEEETPESEPADPTEDAEQSDAPETPPTYKTVIDGKEVEVTLEEALKGYSRTQDYTRKTQELAAQRKAFEEQELAAVRTERQQYAASLGQLQALLTASSPAEPSLATSASPEAFAAEWVQWKQHQEQLAKVTAEQARIKAKEAEDADRGFQQYVQSEKAKLADAIPALKDPAKAPVLQKALTEFAASRGFTPEELGAVTDHRMVLLLHDAMEGHTARAAAKANAPEIKNKIEHALAPSHPGARTSTTRGSKLAEAKARAARTGRPEDAAAAFALIPG